MDLLSWLATILVGIVLGLFCARTPRERPAIRAAFALTSSVGAVTWFLAADAIAGPTMAVGGAIALLSSWIRPAGNGDESHPSR
ncbi:MAG: hypothetical protein ACT4OP_09365 [Actinomycetota bacterium]